MRPRVERYVAELDELIAALDAKARDAARVGCRPRDAAAHDATATIELPSRSTRASARELELLARDAARPQGAALAVRRRAERARTRVAGDGQQHRMLLGVGEHLPVQPVSVPVGEPPLPGPPVARHRRVRGAHAEDGGRVRRRCGAPRDRSPASTTPTRTERELGELDWQDVHRRGVRAVSADHLDGWRRRDARHRLPEPLAADGVGEADPRRSCSTRRSTRTRAARRARAGSPARCRTWRGTARSSTARPRCGRSSR